MADKINIGGINFDNVNIDEAVSIVLNRIKGFYKEKKSMLLVANQDLINKINDNKELDLNQLNESFLTVPDGFSIVYASKFLKTPLKERVAGPDIMLKVLEFSVKNGLKNYFFGNTPDVLKKLTFNLKNIYPELIISGSYSPSYTDKFTDAENTQIIETINSLNPDIIWVSLGCPKQEIWICQNQDKLNAKVIAGVGAAFDFHSGVKRRAPLIFQKINIEWVYRLFQEPARLWKRYFFGGIKFIRIIVKQKKKQSVI